MNGIEFAKWVEQELSRKGISKGEFYEAVGISATALYGWKRGAEPSRKTVATIEKYLESEYLDAEMSDPREELREDLRVLLNSARDLPPSSVYELIAEIHKRKEMGEG